MASFEKFPHGFVNGEYGTGNAPFSLDEQDIFSLSAEIREKPSWDKKMKDPSIVSKWRAEFTASGVSQSEQKFDYVMEELLYYSRLKDDVYEVSTVEGTWQADDAIEESLRQELISQVRVLEDIPELLKDWHPGSNGLVLDLVHPSLYPFVAGRSKVLKDEFITTKDDTEKQCLLGYASDDQCLSSLETSALAFEHLHGVAHYARSRKYQWLPSDVEIREDGSVKFLSYINNLHPDTHTELYATIECILAKFVPLFEKVLTDVRNPRANRIDVPSWYDADDYPEYNEDDEEEVDFQRTVLPIPIPAFFRPPSPSPVVKLNGRNIQVIVKLCNIHLTPANPEYSGGVWHLEGMANERIVSTGIYYYSSENITESRLRFRQAVKEPDYEQNDVVGVATVYGLRDLEALNQNIGSIVTKEGRCIAFPNTLQHQVAPFRLEDSSKAGHRKILVFFLVDPALKILSTSRVPPQQMSWFLKEIAKEPIDDMPNEIVQKIVNTLDWPMQLTEATLHRTHLMNERKYFIQSSNDSYFERPFSLCEH